MKNHVKNELELKYRIIVACESFKMKHSGAKIVVIDIMMIRIAFRAINNIRIYLFNAFILKKKKKKLREQTNFQVQMEYHAIFHWSSLFTYPVTGTSNVIYWFLHHFWFIDHENVCLLFDMIVVSKIDSSHHIVFIINSFNL